MLATSVQAQPVPAHCNTWPMVQTAYVIDEPVVASVIKSWLAPTPKLLTLLEVMALLAMVAAADPGPVAVTSPVKAVMD